MDITLLYENIVTETIEHNGETLELKINADVVTPAYLRELGKRLAPISERLQSVAARIDKLRPKGRSKKKLPPDSPDYLSLESEITVIKREALAERLTCSFELPNGARTQLLKDWNVTEKGEPIQPTKENLIRLPPKTVEGLWAACAKRVNQTLTVFDSNETESGRP